MPWTQPPPAANPSRWALKRARRKARRDAFGVAFAHGASGPRPRCPPLAVDESSLMGWAALPAQWGFIAPASPKYPVVFVRCNHAFKSRLRDYLCAKYGPLRLVVSEKGLLGFADDLCGGCNGEASGGGGGGGAAAAAVGGGGTDDDDGSGTQEATPAQSLVARVREDLVVRRWIENMYVTSEVNQTWAGMLETVTREWAGRDLAAGRPRCFKVFCFPSSLLPRLVQQLPETIELDPHDSAFTHVLYVVRTGDVYMHGVADRAVHFSTDIAVRSDKGVTPPYPGHWMYPFASLLADAGCGGDGNGDGGDGGAAGSGSGAAEVQAESGGATAAEGAAGSASVASRAFFKLHEVLSTEPQIAEWLRRAATAATAAGVSDTAACAPWAIDLGASPGGWSQVLALRGFKVLAVDPGELHPAVLRLNGVTHWAVKAEEVVPIARHIMSGAGDADACVDSAAAFARGDNPFKVNTPLQIAVCDMNCHAEMSCQCLIDIEPLLAPGAPVVLTLKLVNKYYPVPMLVSKVRDVLQRAGFERIQDVWLFANSRFERTLLAWKASGARQGGN